MKYICEDCGAEFDEPFPEPAGVFGFNPLVHLVCPECGSDYFEEVDDEQLFSDVE